MRHRTPAGLRGSGRAARARASLPRAPLVLPALDVGAALRARVGARPRAVVLVDRHGTLTGGELLDLVRLHRSGTATADRAGLAALPAEASLRQVLAAVLAGPEMLELRSSGSTGAPRPQRRGPLAQVTAPARREWCPGEGGAPAARPARRPRPGRHRGPAAR
ncbi:MAG: hypothetical protein LOY01_14680 [Brachybacterium paraconglomeratum]|nr:hypothetical protein [Brachybacterium paraconglomeratum]